MSRRLQHDEPHGAEANHGAVRHRHKRVLRTRPRTEMDRGPCPVAELEVTRDEIRMEMRQEHVADPAPESIRIRQILVYVALRVDNRRQAAVLVSDQIRSVRQTT